jgi:hypothetical protein
MSELGSPPNASDSSNSAAKRGRRKRSASLSHPNPGVVEKKERKELEEAVAAPPKEHPASDEDAYTRDDNDLEYEDLFEDEFEGKERGSTTNWSTILIHISHSNVVFCDQMR